MTRRGREEPDAVLAARIRVGVVGRGDVPLGRGDRVLAPALLAVVPVLLQDEAVVAGADVRADRVLADVLAAAVFHGAFVLVGEEY